MRAVDLSTIELELFREFERSELRRFETRRGTSKRPPTTSPITPGKP